MLDILGERAHHKTQICNTKDENWTDLRTFPKNIKHLNIVLSTLVVKLENSKTAFRKFGKFEERSSNFLENRKFEDFSNEWCHSIRIHSYVHSFVFIEFFEYSNYWKIPLRIFQIFEKPSSNFEFHLQR